MKSIYPIVLTPDGDGYMVYVPDLDINTQGYSLDEAFYMAKDVISLCGVDMQDDGKVVPKPYGVKCELDSNQILGAVEVDFDEYRIKHDPKKVNTMVTIRQSIKSLAQKRKINLSQTLEEAILAKTA